MTPPCERGIGGETLFHVLPVIPPQPPAAKEGACLGQPHETLVLCLGRFLGGGCSLRHGVGYKGLWGYRDVSGCVSQSGCSCASQGLGLVRGKTRLHLGLQPTDRSGAWRGDNPSDDPALRL